MSWFQSSLVAIGLVGGAGPQVAPAAASVAAPMASSSASGADRVVACCCDFVRVTGQVFTGRTGATFRVGDVADDLSGDTFGPRVLDIGGVDPARYLHQHCG